MSKLMIDGVAVGRVRELTFEFGPEPCPTSRFPSVAPMVMITRIHARMFAELGVPYADLYADLSGRTNR